MGWTGFETEIPLGMIFRKMYCCGCGTKLKKHLVTNTINKGEAGYQNTILGQPTIGMDKIKLGYYVYKCPNCGIMITYEEQLKISRESKNIKH